jgi:alpha-L-fucosidase 2
MVVAVGRSAMAADSANTLWYPRPAETWVEALPIGNGRLGAMDYGGGTHERLQLNEDNVWAGGPYDPANPAAYDLYVQARKLILAGKSAEAEALLKVNGLGTPKGQASYQTIGELILDSPGDNASSYRRSLDLNTAITTTTYTIGDTSYTRQVFSSAADQVLVIHITADKPGRINFKATFTTPYREKTIVAKGNELVLNGSGGHFGNMAGQVRHETVVRAVNDGGNVSGDGETMTVSAANAVTLVLACRTNYVNYHDLSADPDALARKDLAAADKPFDQLLADHLSSYQALFDRVKIDLGTSPEADQPTDERVIHFAEGHDPALAALEFQFGRYLLISCSRAGSQPAALQGLWNDSMNPPWNGKFTVNINTEMNYWPAEKTNLPECAVPLFDLIKDVSVTGAHTAAVMYHAPGWVLHHNTDGWRATAPIDFATVGISPTGGAWLLTNVWEHYLYTGDLETLRAFYPIYKGSAEFFLATLVEEPTHHWLVTCPSVSPEHGGLVAGPTMDESILRDLFEQTARISEILNVDPDFRQKVLDARARLAPFQIGKYGQLQEWLQDIDRENDSHRHPSHLYGLFPSAQITSADPKLFAAAKKSLLGRGDAATGWSLAWKLNLWARELDGNHAYLLLTHLLSPPEGDQPKTRQPAIDPKTGKPPRAPERRGGTFPNLFDAHPPFQIDGNFGATSGITEMLMQSHEGFIRLLPALPDAWPTGSITGIIARGGFVVDITWKDHHLASAAITSRLGRPCSVFSATPIVVSGPDHQPLSTKETADHVYSFDTVAAGRYEIATGN